MVLKIEPSNAPESLCEFHLSDGTAFRLHATDMGFWVEDTCGKEGGYKSLSDLFRDYSHHVYYQDNKTPKSVELGSDKFEVTAPDGKVFSANVKNLTATDQVLLRTHNIEEFAEVF